MGAKQRIRYIDTLRGMGILLMIMGHVGFSSLVDHWIHAFHMPMFFVISGYFFKDFNVSVISFIKKKAKVLLVPYVVFAIFHYLVWMILFRNDDIFTPLIHLAAVNTSGLPIAGALWFLTCLFIVDIGFYFLRKKIKSGRILFIIIFVISLLGTILTEIVDFRLPWAMDTAMVGIGLYYIGYELKKNQENTLVKRFLNLNCIETAVLFIVISALCFVNGYINLREGKYAIIPLFWVNAIVMTLVLWNASKIIDGWKCKFNLVTLIINELKFLGENSIVYVCLNQIFILGVTKVLDRITISDSIAVKLVIKFMILCISLVLMHIVTKIIMETKLKTIIGR